MKKFIREALDQFLKAEENNILSGVSERNLCARLSIVLESLANQSGLKGYYADTEYNRKQGGQVKTILDDDYEVIVINADLILHSRGEILDRDNLIAIEMKKSNRSEEDKNSDRKRLRAMTKTSYDDIWAFDGETHPEHVCGYELGVYLEINIETRTVEVELYSKGRNYNSYNINF